MTWSSYHLYQKRFRHTWYIYYKTYGTSVVSLAFFSCKVNNIGIISLEPGFTHPWNVLNISLKGLRKTFDEEIYDMHLHSEPLHYISSSQTLFACSKFKLDIKYCHAFGSTDLLWLFSWIIQEHREQRIQTMRHDSDDFHLPLQTTP